MDFYEHGKRTQPKLCLRLHGGNFKQLQIELGESYPSVFLILGNDDPRFTEIEVLSGDTNGVWKYVSEKGKQLSMNSRFTATPMFPPLLFCSKIGNDTMCLASSTHGLDFPRRRLADYSYALEPGSTCHNPERSGIINCWSRPDQHHPPFPLSPLQHRLGLNMPGDGKTYDHVPLDTHAGSIAIRRFIENRQPRPQPARASPRILLC